MKSKKLISLAAFLLLSTFGQTLGQRNEETNTIVLVNGSTFVGNVLSVTCNGTNPQTINFQIKNVSDNLKIDTAGISSLNFTNSSVQIISDGVSRSTVITPGTYSGKTTLNLNDFLKSMCLPQSTNVANNAPDQTDQSDPLIFRGRSTINSTFTSSTTVQRTVGATFDFSIESGDKYAKHNDGKDSWLKHRVTAFVMDIDYGTSAKRNEAFIMNNRRYSGKITQSFINNKNTVFGFARLSHHFVLGMRFQEEYGIGYRRTFAAEKKEGEKSIGEQLKNNLVLSFDLRQIRQKLYAPGTRFSSLGSGIAVDNSFVTGPKDYKIIFTGHLEVIPAFKSAKALQAHAFLSATFPVSKRLGLTLLFGDDFLRNAPSGRRQNYSKTTFGFSYDLGSK